MKHKTNKIIESKDWKVFNTSEYAFKFILS